MKKKMKKSLVVFILLIFVAVIGTGCNKTEKVTHNDSNQEEVAAIEQLNIGCIYEFDMENPQSDLMKYLNYDSFVFANLVRYDMNNEVVPCLAESYEISEDGTAVTFSFADGMKWHDGTDLTMEDIEFSLNLWMDKLKPSVALRYMKDVEVLDSHTIRINMQSSCAVVFLRHMIMSSAGCVIYPKHIWENVEDLKTFTGPEAMIGNGPYTYEGYDEEAKIVYFKAFEDYYEGAPAVERIAFKLYNSPENLVMAYKNNEIDCMYQYAAGLSGTYMPSLSNLKGLNVGQTVNLGSPILEFNFQDSLMQDLDIRQAVYYALNYPSIAMTVGGQYAHVASKGVISPGNVGYAEDLPENVQDVEKANQILDKAGYIDIDGDGIRENKDGQKMKIMVSSLQSASKGQLYDRIAQAVINDMRNVGLDAYLDEEIIGSSDAWKARHNTDKNFQIAITSCSQGVAIIDTVSQGLVQKAGVDGTMTWNGTNSTPEYVDIFSAIIDSKTPEEYAQAAYQSQHYMADNMIAISLGVEDVFYPYNDGNFTGWVSREGNGVFTFDSMFSLRRK